MVVVHSQCSRQQGVQGPGPRGLGHLVALVIFHLRRHLAPSLFTQFHPPYSYSESYNGNSACPSCTKRAHSINFHPHVLTAKYTL